MLDNPLINGLEKFYRANMTLIEFNKKYQPNHLTNVRSNKNEYQTVNLVKMF